jgi:Flp pilus assembly pilin Flp
MKKKMNFKSFQTGQGMTEYIIIVALIAVAAIGVYSFFGQAIRSQMSGMTNELAGQSSQASRDQAKTAAGSASTEGTTTKNMGSYGNTQK